MKMKWQDFSMGIADDVVDADPRSAARLDNVLLNNQGKPYQRPAIVPKFATKEQLPSGNQRVDSLFYFDGAVFAKSATKLYYKEVASGSWTELSTIAGKAAFGDSVLGADVSWSTWQGHVFATPRPYSGASSGCRTIKIYRYDGDSVWRCEQAGVPSMKDISGFAPPSGVGSGSGGQEHAYVFAICFRRKWSALVNGVSRTFVSYGRPTMWPMQMEAPAHGVADFQFTGPTFANGTLDNYTIANFGVSTLRVSSFRTKADDTVLYFVDLDNQGATVLFEQTDAQIGSPAVNRADQDSPEFYMNGGRKANGKVPICLYSLVLGDYAFYMAYYDDDDLSFHGNRVLQSNPANPEGCWHGNYVEYEGDPRGLDYAGSFPIPLTSVGAYRLEGRFDAFGGGGMRLVRIPGSRPAIAGKATVRVDGALLYASTDGWIFTDGYKAINLSEHLKTRYSTLLNKDRMALAYDGVSQQVWISVEDPNYDAISGSNTLYFILDVKKTLANGLERGVFTTASTAGRSRAHSLFYVRDLSCMLIGDMRGYVMTLDSTKYCDSVVDTAVSVSAWTTAGIVWSLITAAFSSGDTDNDKYHTKVFATFKRITGNLSMIFYFLKDLVGAFNDVSFPSSGVRDRGLARIHKVDRWIAQGARWATFLQVHAKKNDAGICFSSDEKGTASVNGTANTMTFGSIPTFDDGSNIVGLTVRLSSDNYASAYPIASVSGNVATLTDAGNTLPTGSGIKWLIYGVPKDETMELVDLSVEIMDEGEVTDDSYKVGTSGSNQ